MAENIVDELLLGRRFWRITPPKEKLLEKVIGLEEHIARYRAGKLDDEKKQILKSCEDYLKVVKEILQSKGSSHPHLLWNLLHRVDEQMILLMEEHELSARAIDVKASFDLTIKEEAVRKEWLGDKGKLVEAMKDIESGAKNQEKSRYIIKEALQYLDDFVDYGFWKLSMNNFMTVASAFLLAVVMLVYYFVPALRHGILPESQKPVCIAMLGLMGGYLSNLLTKEDFLFVWGGPFFRYLFYNLLARPVIGAFSAVFFFAVEKTKLIFSINPVYAAAQQVAGNTVAAGSSSVLTINVGPANIGYAYIVFAIAVGFAGEKALREMMDKVLKRLEEKAEKTKETSPETAKKSKKD